MHPLNPLVYRGISPSVRPSGPPPRLADGAVPSGPTYIRPKRVACAGYPPPRKIRYIASVKHGHVITSGPGHNRLLAARQTAWFGSLLLIRATSGPVSVRIINGLAP